MSFFLLGPYLGGGLALILGGTVVQALGNPNGNGGINGLEPWRAAFLVAGCIGVVPALLLFFIREPARPIVAAASVATSFSLGEVARFMWRERAFYGAFYGRSEERRVGKKCVRTCRSRWSPYHSIKTYHIIYDSHP